MKSFFQIAPLALLIAGALLLIRKGMRTDPNGTNNTESFSSGLESGSEGGGDGGD